MSSTIRVLVVDDSRMHRKALSAYLRDQADIEVVGEARDGEDGLESTRKLKPDVVLMDVRMPRMDGFNATQRIMSECPTPILLMTIPDNLAQDVSLGLKAIEYGALDLIPKPDLETLQTESQLADRLRLLARVPVIRHPLSAARASRNLQGAGSRRSTGYFKRAKRLVAIAASTGGPKALTILLAGLPVRFKAAVVIVQHIDAAFEVGLVRWLDEHCRLDVVLGRDDMELREGTVYVAPQGRHAEVNDRRRLVLVEEPKIAPGSHCPSGDRLLQSVAKVYGSQAVGCVLTGIGRDGADGLLELRHKGGLTIAQDEATSVVYGMPQAAVANGGADLVLPMDEIAHRITRAIS